MGCLHTQTEIQDRNRSLKLFSLAKIKDFYRKSAAYQLIFKQHHCFGETYHIRESSVPVGWQHGRAEPLSWGQLTVKVKAGGLLHPLIMEVFEGLPHPALCQGPV